LGNSELLRECLLSALVYGATPLQCYEALLQTYLFAGFPSALEGITVFQALCKENDIIFDAPVAAEYNISVFSERGAAFCETIYTNAYSKMRTNLATLSPDLAEWMIVEGYGKTLSRKGLTPRVRELLNVSVLAVSGWKTQLYSHLRGAMNVGAQPIECIDILSNLEIFTEPHIQERIKAAKLVLETLLGRTEGNEHHA
jgi:4-carboxymuconolactone decarboxylase